MPFLQVNRVRMLNNMSADDYINSQVDPCIRKYEDLSHKYHKIHMGLMIACFSCFIGVIILNVVYIIVPVIWLVLASIVCTLGGLLLFFFDSLNGYLEKSLSYKHKAESLGYEKSLYKAKENGFKGFAYRCERYM
jgi:VIT1/CCC1 family predicted Fe2+/Mn2+ transporter